MTNLSDDETMLEGDDGQNPQEGVKSSLPRGSRLGDYEIDRLIGAGAMGEVYLARQIRLAQKCALKVLPEILTKSADFERRFESEGRSLAKLDHPNVVRVLYAGMDSGRHYFSMEYVGGGSLDDYIAERGTLPESEARKILAEILSGLSYAHRLEIIHRDLKPANILRTNDGHAKISDFGLALVAGEDYMRTVVDESVRRSQLAGAGGSVSKKPSIKTPVNLDYDETLPANDKSVPAPPKSGGDDETVLESELNNPPRRPSRRSSASDASAFVGTIDYMSPEIRYGRGVADARSDIYAIGVMAYQMLTGRKPLGYVRPPSKIVRGLSRKWDEWVFKCMEDDPTNRFQTAGEALEKLPESGKGIGWMLPTIIGAALLIGVAAGVWFWGAGTTNDAAKTENARASVDESPVAKPVENPAPVETKPEPPQILETHGNLAITTVPAGATVRVNDSTPETSPCDYTGLPSGDCVVTASLDGYETASVKVVVPNGGTLAVPAIVLKRETGIMEINSDPHSLAWRLVKTPGDFGGDYPSSGTTPATLNNLPTGSYLVELSREGWGTEQIEAKIESGKTFVASHEFKSGAIYFTSNIQGVLWTVVSGPLVGTAKKYKGETPFTLSDLPPGDYVIEFAKQYWPTVQKKVAVESGKIATVTANMERPTSNTNASADASSAQSNPVAKHVSQTEASPSRGPTEGMNWIVPECDMEMIWIRPGTFQMGSSTEEKGRKADEIPHTVTISKGFWLGKFEVTQRQWKAVMGENPSGFTGVDDAPVEQVSWYDAVEFCDRLTMKERLDGKLPKGYEYCLPTEAQWEYACRAGTNTPYYFGNDEGSLWKYCNYCDRSNTDRLDWKDFRHSDGCDKTAKTGSFMPNQWGMYDMSGNVWEWCNDLYGGYQPGAVVDPEGAKSGKARVRRGGCWNSNVEGCRCANRDFINPVYRNYASGFRMALKTVN